MIERTTVRLPSELLDRARRKAVTEGRTLTSLIEDGLRHVVTEDRRTATKRVMPRISKASGGLMPGVDLSKFEDLQEIEDLEYLERLQHQK